MATIRDTGRGGAGLASGTRGFISERVALTERAAMAFGPQLTTDGIVSASLDLSLAGNAVVKVLDLVVQARRASATPVQDVAQVRVSESGAGTDAMTVVVDFGTPRTVSAVQLPAPLGVVRVRPWIGMGFAPTAVFTARGRAGGESVTRTALLDNEVRTERLLVDVAGTLAVEELAAGMSVLLPEAPADLELRIDGGAPVWSLPGPAAPGPEATASTQAWSRDGERVVHLGPVLAALTGDATRPAPRDFHISLHSRVPGVLGLRRGATEVAFAWRVGATDGDGQALDFAGEGARELELDLPAPAPGAARAVESLALVVTGEAGPRRALPPVGPPAAGEAGTGVLAELVLDPEHAACVHLDGITRLASLEALRLPLAAMVDAEARVVLWRGETGGSTAPVEALAQASSEPVVMTVDAGERWVSFPFARPVTVDPSVPLWAAVVVTRGELTWALGTGPAPGVGAVLTGTPAGGWRTLPPPLRVPGSALASLGGRFRLVGEAPQDAPLAPLVLGVPGTAIRAEITPTARGQAVGFRLTPPLVLAPGATPRLRVTALQAGNFTLRSLDVIASA